MTRQFVMIFIYVVFSTEPNQHALAHKLTAASSPSLALLGGNPPNCWQIYIYFCLPSRVPITRLAPSFLRSYESEIDARTTGWIFTTGPNTDMLEKEDWWPARVNTYNAAYRPEGEQRLLHIITFSRFKITFSSSFICHRHIIRIGLKQDRRLKCKQCKI